MVDEMNLKDAKRSLRFILESPKDYKESRFVVNDRLSLDERKAILWLVAKVERLGST